MILFKKNKLFYSQNIIFTEFIIFFKTNKVIHKLNMFITIVKV